MQENPSQARSLQILPRGLFKEDVLKNIDESITSIKIGTRTEPIDFPCEIVNLFELPDKTKLNQDWRIEAKKVSCLPENLSPIRVHHWLHFGQY